MFFEGTVKAYNSDKGYGFITIDGENKDIFFHITNCPSKHIEPKQGERFKFITTNNNGKIKADKIVRLDLKVETERYTPQSRALSIERKVERTKHSKNNSSGGVGMTIIGLLITAGLIYGIYYKYQGANLANQSTSQTQQMSEASNNTNPNGYRCDGRVHCSQMNSREEARWFTRNCPGTKMDGNNDGEPCERDSRW